MDGCTAMERSRESIKKYFYFDQWRMIKGKVCVVGIYTSRKLWKEDMIEGFKMSKTEQCNVRERSFKKICFLAMSLIHSGHFLLLLKRSTSVQFLEGAFLSLYLRMLLRKGLQCCSCRLTRKCFLSDEFKFNITSQYHNTTETW